jgi:hypothetical protein
LENKRALNKTYSGIKEGEGKSIFEF